MWFNLVRMVLASVWIRVCGRSALVYSPLSSVRPRRAGVVLVLFRVLWDAFLLVALPCVVCGWGVGAAVLG